MATPTNRMLFAADMSGTLVFAVEGALAGHEGSIVRDVLIGDIPPAAPKSWLGAAVAFAGGAI